MVQALADRDEALSEKDKALSEKDNALAEMEEELELLKKNLPMSSPNPKDFMHMGLAPALTSLPPTGSQTTHIQREEDRQLEQSLQNDEFGTASRPAEAKTVDPRHVNPVAWADGLKQRGWGFPARADSAYYTSETGESVRQDG